LHCNEALGVGEVSAGTKEVNVPLSEHEHRVLQQMEQALSAQDPTFVSQMRRARVTAVARITIGVVGVLVGLGLLLVGVNTTAWLGVAGFALMVTSASFAVTAPRWRVGVGTRTPSGDR
jgi:uncharacterized membrane protein YkgB